MMGILTGVRWYLIATFTCISNNELCGTSFHVSLGHLYIFYLGPLSIFFNLGCLFLQIIYVLKKRLPRTDLTKPPSPSRRPTQHTPPQWSEFGNSNRLHNKTHKNWNLPVAEKRNKGNTPNYQWKHSWDLYLENNLAKWSQVQEMGTSLPTTIPDVQQCPQQLCSWEKLETT